MFGLIFAGLLEDGSVPVKVLAIIGGAVLGALFVGFLTNLLTRLATTRKLPRAPLNMVRVLGAVAVGWLVYLFVFGGLGNYLGGSGGPHIGSSGNSTATTPSSGPTVTPVSTARGPSEPRPTAAETIQIEVLGADALNKLGKKAEPQRCYRLETETGPQLVNFKGVKDFINLRKNKQPPLRQVVLVLYKDSPARDTPVVRDLKMWAGDLDVDGGQRMKVDVEDRDAYAPVL